MEKFFTRNFSALKSKQKEILLNSFGKYKEESCFLERVGSYFHNKAHEDASQVLTDKTCSDLDFNELFMFVDRTSSKVGQQVLYNKLRSIQYNASEVQENESIIKAFTENPEFRLKVQLQLAKLNDNKAFYISSLFQNEYPKPPVWFPLIKILSILSLASLILTFIVPPFFLLFVGVLVINSGIHYWNKKNVLQYIGSIPQLLMLSSIAVKLHKYAILKPIDPHLEDHVEEINKVRNRMSLFQMDEKYKGEIFAILIFFVEILKLVFLIEPILLFGILRRLTSKRPDIEQVFEFVGKVDMLISIASLRAGLKTYCHPTIHEELKSMTAVGIHHPLIMDCVANSIDLRGKSVLLTGSNMSGKTSFIRSIGVNVISGLTLNTCYAESFSMPLVNVSSAIRISDDLMNDRSYYFEEVLTIKGMIQQSQSKLPNLFLLDELFKGTNTIERIAAGKAVLSHLANANNIVFVSTHDIELADLLKDEYDLYHFSERVENKMVDFDYKLKAGKLQNRNAIRILQINDYPTSIIEEALTISKSLEPENIPNPTL